MKLKVVSIQGPANQVTKVAVANGTGRFEAIYTSLKNVYNVLETKSSVHQSTAHHQIHRHKFGVIPLTL